MLKVFVIFLLIFNLQARENPFFPSQGEKDLPFTSNENTSKASLSRVSLTLPSTARIIKKVTVEYENLDASQETKSIELDNKVDWHLPIFVSQSYAVQKTTTEKMPLVKKIKKTKKFKEVAKIKQAHFLVAGKELIIMTDDSLIRNFLLARPHRIVMDFKRETSMKSYFKAINNSVFTKVRVGKHKGYYRVVVELDGYYRYVLKKVKNGCLIIVK